MKKLMTNLAVKGQCFLASLKDGSLKNDERGVSPLVITVLIILVGVLLVAIFWKYIKEWFEDIWTRITDQTDTIK